MSRTEAIALVSALRGLIPGSRSKYYTREVESRLREILGKDPDSFTMDNVEELIEIARLMEKVHGLRQEGAPRLSGQAEDWGTSHQGGSRRAKDEGT